MLVRDALFDLFRQRGIDRIFGNPGSTELTMLAGLPDDIDYVLCLHEHVAVAAAAGFAALAGRPSIVNLHTLPGLANGAGAITTAASNRAPVVITAGQQDTRHLRTEPLLSGPMVEFVEPLVKWSHQPVLAADVPAAFERAIRIAMTPPRGPVFLSLPMDFMEGEAEPVVAHDPQVDARLSAATLQELVETLAQASSPALVTSPSVELSGGWDAAIGLAEALDASVYAQPLAAKFGFPTSHPNFAGHLLPSARAIHGALEKHDVVLVAGGPAFVRYPYSDHPLVPDSTQAILLTDAAEDAARFEIGRPVICDVGAALGAIVEGLPSGDRPRRAVAEEAHEVAPDEDVLNVIAVCKEIRTAFGDDFTLLDESVSNGPTLRANLHVSSPNRVLRSSNGGLGSILPNAIGAAMAEPSRPVLVTIGDGSMMYSPQALWTMARRNLPVKVIVLNNGSYKILQDFHASSFTHLGDMVESDLPELDLGDIATGCGVPNTRVTTVDELRTAIKEAAGSQGPWLIDVRLGGASPSMFD